MQSNWRGNFSLLDCNIYSLLYSIWLYQIIATFQKIRVILYQSVISLEFIYFLVQGVGTVKATIHATRERPRFEGSYDGDIHTLPFQQKRSSLCVGLLAPFTLNLLINWPIQVGNWNSQLSSPSSILFGWFMGRIMLYCGRMGAGRKTQTFTRNERIPSFPTTVNTSVSARNLRKGDLGGVIFGCKHQTMAECLSKQLFGLPAPHFSYVKNIEPGLPLFLFNYSDRKLHGVFESASSGKMNINPYAWTENGSERTQYPSQVCIRIRTQCQPLQEMQFRPIICDNFYTSSHFWFELDHAQVESLVVLFTATCNRGARLNPPYNLPNRRQSNGNADSTSVRSTRMNLFVGSKEGTKPSAMLGLVNRFEALGWEDPANNDSGSCSVSSSIGYDGNLNLSEFPDLNPTSKNIGCSSASPCFDGESKALEAPEEIWGNDDEIDELMVGMQLMQALKSFQME